MFFKGLLRTTLFQLQQLTAASKAAQTGAKLSQYLGPIMFKKIVLVAAIISLSACSSKMSAPALSQEQMMQNMHAAAAIGDQHKFLKQLSGNWNAETTMWFPGVEKPEVSKGKASFTPIYGGRYLQMNYQGKFMGQKFNGQGLMGYDNVKGKFFSTWIDSMMTGHMMSEGGSIQDNSITLESKTICPGTREEMKTVEKLAIVSKDSFNWSSFVKDGSDLNKMMEIKYSRVK